MTDKPPGSQPASRNVNQFMSALDEKSKQIIALLKEERHAEIRELSHLIHASSDMEVLIRIREVINSQAQRFLGEPLIIFKRSKMDSLIGEKITFSWWLNERLADSVSYWELPDIFDEKDFLRVVVPIPLQDEDVKVEVKDNSLIISGEKYCQEVTLPCSVEKSMKKIVNNGILEVTLDKIGENYGDRHR